MKKPRVFLTGFVKHLLKPSACAFGFMLYLLLGSLGSLTLPQTAYAAVCTRGGNAFLCATWVNGQWQRGDAGSGAVTGNVRVGGFTFPNPNPGYPVDSTNYVHTQTEGIHIRRGIGGSPPTNIPVVAKPTNLLEWVEVNGRSGFRVRGLSNNFLLNFEFRAEGGAWIKAGRNGATFYVTAPALNSSKDSALEIRVQATVLGDMQTQTLPLANIFNVDFGTMSNLGQINIIGNPAPTIVPPAPPPPRTCDAIPAGTTRVFNLNPIDVTSLRAGAESSASATQNVTLTNCPTGITLRMAMSDSAFPNNNNDYLRNQSGTDYATNAGIRLYYNGTEKVTMNSWRKDVTTTAATMNLPFTAKYYHIGGNLGIGKVRSTATLTITYP